MRANRREDLGGDHVEHAWTPATRFRSHAVLFAVVTPAVVFVAGCLCTFLYTGRTPSTIGEWGGAAALAIWLLVGIGICARAIQAVRWRSGVLIFVGFSVLFATSLAIAVPVGFKLTCGHRGVPTASLLRWVGGVMQKHARASTAPVSIAVELTRAADGDWYTRSDARCDCRAQSEPVIGTISLRDVFAGRVSLASLETEAVRLHPVTGGGWEHVGDYLFARDPAIWRTTTGKVITSAGTHECPPNVGAYVHFGDGTVRYLSAVDPADRESVADAAQEAIRLGLEPPPDEFLAIFGISGLRSLSEPIPSPTPNTPGG